MIYFKWLNKKPLKTWLHSNADHQQLSAQQSVSASRRFYSHLLFIPLLSICRLTHLLVIKVPFLKNTFRKQNPITSSRKRESKAFSSLLPNIPTISHTSWEMAHNQLAKSHLDTKDPCMGLWSRSKCFWGSRESAYLITHGETTTTVASSGILCQHHGRVLSAIFSFVLWDDACLSPIPKTIL